VNSGNAARNPALIFEKDQEVYFKLHLAFANVEKQSPMDRNTNSTDIL